jgi:hypothetical protein
MNNRESNNQLQSERTNQRTDELTMLVDVLAPYKSASSLMNGLIKALDENRNPVPTVTGFNQVSIRRNNEEEAYIFV